MKPLLLSLLFSAAAVAQTVTSVTVEIQIGNTTVATAQAAGTVGATDSLSVADCTAFTDTPPFFIFVQNETEQVTAPPSPATGACTLAVVRGSQGTRAPTHAVGVSVGRQVTRNFNANLIASYVAWIATQQTCSGTPQVCVPKYKSIDDLLYKHLRDSLHTPVLLANPPAATAAAIAAKTAQDATITADINGDLP